MWLRVPCGSYFRNAVGVYYQWVTNSGDFRAKQVTSVSKKECYRRAASRCDLHFSLLGKDNICHGYKKYSLYYTEN